MRLPEFDLPTASGDRLTNADLEGRPWYVYMARHPGCFICQHHLALALERRAEVQALGGDLVVFFCSDPERTREWFEKSDLPRDLTVVMDPDGDVYKPLGTVRGSFFAELRHSLRGFWTARKHVRKWRLTRNDMMRMGADAAVGPDGEIARLHVCKHPDDRLPPGEVLGALRAAEHVAA